MLIARGIGRGLFKAVALVGAFVLITVLWFLDASLLTTAADENLRLVKTVTALLPVGWASKVESALRIFGADRALLLIEGVAITKLIMLATGYPFRQRAQVRSVPQNQKRASTAPAGYCRSGPMLAERCRTGTMNGCKTRSSRTSQSTNSRA